MALIGLIMCIAIWKEVFDTIAEVLKAIWWSNPEDYENYRNHMDE